MKVKSPEFAAVAITMLMVVVSSLWFGSLLRTTDEAIDHTQPASNIKYVSAAGLELISVKPIAWPEPPAQARGVEWIYDVFTPPQIYFDTEKQEFRVAVDSKTASEPSSDGDGFELKLLEVGQAEYPLRLVGYVGEAGHFLGTFENRVTSETLLLTTGDKIKSLELTILELLVEQTAISIQESMTINEYQATARVQHNLTREIVTLKQGTILYTADPIARFSIPEDPQVVLIAKEGEVITHGETRFIINKIRLAPASVDVTKEHAGTDSAICKTLLIGPLTELVLPRLPQNENYQ